MTSDAPDQPGTDDRRAQQIAAVRDVLGWGEQPDAFNEEACATTAAQLVDAVMAHVEATPGSLVVSLTDAEAALKRLDSKAHAAGYARAVTALRDDSAHERWGEANNRAIWGSPIRDNLADYLEAVGPGTEPTTGAAEVVHLCPNWDEPAFTPCCGRTPFELPRTDRFTTDEAQATCPGPKPDAVEGWTLAQVMGGAREREAGNG